MEEERLGSRGEFERVRKETFVEAMLHQVADGLGGDSRFGSNPANQIRRRVEDIAFEMQTDGSPPADQDTSAGRAVLNSRFALGHDDSQYLSQAVSLLWAGDGGERLRIVPASMMPRDMRHASARGIVNAMSSVMKKKDAESRGKIKDGLETAAWLMEMREVRDAVVLYMRASEFPEVQNAAEKIEREYTAGNKAGMDFVYGLISNNPGDDSVNIAISSAVMEALFVLTDDRSDAMAIVERLKRESKGIVTRAAADSAFVAEAAAAVGYPRDGGSVRGPPLADIIPQKLPNTTFPYDHCPTYAGMNGGRDRDEDGPPPLEKEFYETVSRAFARVVARHTALEQDAGLETNVAPGKTATAGKPWTLTRVVSPLWNQGGLNNEDSDLLDAAETQLRPDSDGELTELAIVGDMQAAAENYRAHRNVLGAYREDRLGDGDAEGSLFVDYCMLRGLCGFQGPHQALDVAHPLAGVLKYSYPTSSMSRRYVSGARAAAFFESAEPDLPDDTLAYILAQQSRVFDKVADGMLHTDFFGHVVAGLPDREVVNPEDDFEDLERARPVMWAPIAPDDTGREISYGEVCKSICEAAVYEFMATSLLKSAESENIDPKTTNLFVAAAACAKIAQLSPLTSARTYKKLSSKFTEMPTGGDRVQYVTRPGMHCGRVGGPVRADRVLLPVDAGIARFEADVQSPPPLKISIVAPGADGPSPDMVPGFYDSSFRTSRGEGKVPNEMLSSWLRSGAEEGVSDNVELTFDYPKRDFSLVIETDAQNHPVDAGELVGKVGPYLENKPAWLEPLDVDVEVLASLFRGSISALSDLEQIKHEEVYISKLQSEGSKERQQVFGLERSVEDASRDRRAAVWSDALREVAVSSDRLYRFVTILTGAIGESADSAISWEDDDLKAVSKENASRQKQVAERVSRFQTKMVESVVTSTLKASKLQLDLARRADGGDLVVMSSDVKDSIRRLVDGEAGHGFFESSVELQNMMSGSQSPMSIRDIVQSLQGVSGEYYNQIAGTEQFAPASYQRVVEPRNSYMMHLKPDTSAAVQKAFDFITSELRACGGYHRHVHLWEFVEGKDWTLVTRFAELVGLMLQNTRMRSGNFAAYVGTSQLISNGYNIRMQIQRLKSQACHYLLNNGETPAFLAEHGRTLYFDGSISASNVEQPTGRGKRKISELGREAERRKRQGHSAPFGGDDGDDSDDKPGAPPRSKQREQREILKKLGEYMRARREAARRGPGGVLKPISFQKLLEASVTLNDIDSRTGFTKQQVLEALQAKFNGWLAGLSTAEVCYAAEAVLEEVEVGSADPMPEGCKGMFRKSDGTPAPGLKLEIAICESLEQQKFKFAKGVMVLESAPRGTIVRMPVNGKMGQYWKVQIPTDKCWEAQGKGAVLQGRDHRSKPVRMRISHALSHVFGMRLGTDGKELWFPHPSWTTMNAGDPKVQNVWLRPFYTNEDLDYKKVRDYVRMTLWQWMWLNKMPPPAAAAPMMTMVTTHARKRKIFAAVMRAAISVAAGYRAFQYFNARAAEKPKAAAGPEANIAKDNSTAEERRLAGLAQMEVDAEIAQLERVKADDQDGFEYAIMGGDARMEELQMLNKLFNFASISLEWSPHARAAIEQFKLKNPKIRGGWGEFMAGKFEPPDQKDRIRIAQSMETMEDLLKIGEVSSALAEALNTYVESENLGYDKVMDVFQNIWKPKSEELGVADKGRYGNEDMFTIFGGVPAELLHHPDPRVPLSHYEQRLEYLLSPEGWAEPFKDFGYVEYLASVFSPPGMSPWRDAQAVADERVKQIEICKARILYFQDEVDVYLGMNPQLRPPSEWFDPHTWPSFLEARVLRMTKIAVVYAGLGPKEKKSIIAKTGAPLIKMFFDFRESGGDVKKAGALKEWSLKPENRAKIEANIMDTFGIDEAKMEDLNIMPRFVAIASKGDMGFVDAISELFVESALALGIEGKDGVSPEVARQNFEAAEKRRLEHEAQVSGERFSFAEDKNGLPVDALPRGGAAPYKPLPPRTDATALSIGNAFLEQLRRGWGPKTRTLTEATSLDKTGGPDSRLAGASGLLRVWSTNHYHVRSLLSSPMELQQLRYHHAMYLLQTKWGRAIDTAGKTVVDEPITPETMVGVEAEECKRLAGVNDGGLSLALCYLLGGMEHRGEKIFEGNFKTKKLAYAFKDKSAMDRMQKRYGRLTLVFPEKVAGELLKVLNKEFLLGEGPKSRWTQMEEAMSLALNSLLCLPLNVKFKMDGNGVLRWSRSLADRDKFATNELAVRQNMDTMYELAGAGGLSYEDAWRVYGFIGYNVLEAPSPEQVKALTDAAKSPVDARDRETIMTYISDAGFARGDLEQFASNSTIIGEPIKALQRPADGPHPYKQAFTDLVAGPVPRLDTSLSDNVNMFRAFAQLLQGRK